MRMFSLMALVLAFGLSLGVTNAEAAKRLGSGQSSGAQRQSSVDKSPGANNTAKAPTAPAAAAPAAAAPKRSWMGPLAGIAAGLGLAALASHFGFGEQLASMMMFGLIAMAIMVVIGLVMRKRAAAKQDAMGTAGGMQYAGAGTGYNPANTPAKPFDVAMPASGAGSMIGSNLASGAGSDAQPVNAIPADFDAVGFANNAKTQFIRLQAANDTSNLNDIRSFTTPEMFTGLAAQINERNGVPQQTDVVSLDAQVIEVTEDSINYVVSVRFVGSIRENQAAAESFNEIWNLVKPRNGSGGWVLAGIEQSA